ncbi:MAG: Ig-like domain-containing protein, partial [Nitrosomonas sp.]|nr:Ig-like domain-containing protein [Nitrosomonas sp.]MDP1952016.1 Ig-like domain-containing protein [Nitrosomonas sp.]
PPELAWTNPLDNAVIEVDNVNGISLSFDQLIQAGSGTIGLYNALDDSLVESFDVNTEQGSASGVMNFGKGGDSVQLTPGSDLIGNTDYYVLVGATAITDPSGNAFAGINDPTAFNFKAVDLPPELTGTSPSDNGVIEVDNVNDISLYFDQRIQAGSGTIGLYNALDNSLVESFDVNTGQGSASGVMSLFYGSVYFTPGGDLIANMDYYVLVDGTAITDPSGNAFAGIDDPTVFNFQTY